MKHSQINRILDHLMEHKENWVSMPSLVHVSGSYNIHSRITELRKKGHNIESLVKPMPDGSKHSSYRIISA